MILSNDDKAMALGEVFSIFNPIYDYQFDLIQKLNSEDPKWNKIIKGGKKDLFKNLEKLFPEIDVFVDSSKDPFWYRYHGRINESKFEIKNILIYKTPEELAQSFIKRGKGKNWVKTYINYHKKII